MDISSVAVSLMEASREPFWPTSLHRPTARWVAQATSNAAAMSSRRKPSPRRSMICAHTAPIDGTPMGSTDRVIRRRSSRESNDCRFGPPNVTEPRCQCIHTRNQYRWTPGRKQFPPQPKLGPCMADRPLLYWRLRLSAAICGPKQLNSTLPPGGRRQLADIRPSRLIRHPKYWLHDVTRVRTLEREFDVREIEVFDQAVHRKPALPVQVDD